MSISYATLVASEILVWAPTTNANLSNLSNANIKIPGGPSNQAVCNWLQAIILEVIIYSFACRIMNMSDECAYGLHFFIPKKAAKVTVYSLAFVLRFFDEIWICHRYGVSILSKPFQGSSSKNDCVIKENHFRIIYVVCTFITPLLKLQNAPKIGETFFNYVSTLNRSWKFYYVISKKAGDTYSGFCKPHKTQNNAYTIMISRAFLEIT